MQRLTRVVRKGKYHMGPLSKLLPIKRGDAMAAKICLAIILFANALISFANVPEWKELAIQDDILIFSYDAKNTTFERNDVITYLKILFKNPPAPDIAYTVDFIRFGCTRQLTETLRVVTYDSNGRETSDSGAQSSVKQPMPGSPGDRLRTAVCAVRPFWRKWLDYFK